MLTSNSILQLQNVTITAPLLTKPILNEVNYQINSGDFVILLGSNGSGKSSLLKLLDRRYQASSGQIFFDDIPIEKYSQRQFCQRVISLTQDVSASLFLSFTVLENCLMAERRCKGFLFNFNQDELRAFFCDYLQKFNLKLAKKLNEVTVNLSGGEQQALALALSVLYPPKLLLLDEHTSALDPKTAVNIMQLTAQVITEHKITCILATHNLEIAANYGNKILILSDGKILREISKRANQTIDINEFLQNCYGLSC